MPLAEIEQNHVIRFENGDVLWMLPIKEASGICVVPSVGPVEQVITWEFKGGSGRFEGATGQATWRLKGDPIPLGAYIMYAVHPGPFEGYITLKNKQGK